MPERIGAAPNGAERAKSRFIQHFQELEIRVDCFRAFDMKNGCQHAVLQAPVNIIDMAADADAALRLLLDTRKRDTMMKSAPNLRWVSLNKAGH